MPDSPAAEATIDPTPTLARRRHRPPALVGLWTSLSNTTTCLVLGALLAGCASADARPPVAKRATVAKPVHAPPATARAQARQSTPIAAAAVPAPVTRADAAPDPASVADAEPVVQAVRSDGPNRPYQLAGRSFVPLTTDQPVVERGVASWYGRQFHGRRTASGEAYDMHAMTAAHPTLPLPSYALVRNPSNGREVVVRVNDRGPFHPGRIIDLSQVAARKLGMGGLGTVEVRRLTNEEIRTGSWRRAPSDGADGDDRRLAARYPDPALSAMFDKAADTSSSPGASTTPATAPVAPWAPSLVAFSGSPASSAEPPRPGGDDQALPGSAPPPGEPVLATLAAPSAGFATVANVATVGFATAGADGAAGTTRAAGAPSSAPVRPAYWVQVGAFRVRDGAESFKTRVAQDLHWLAPVLSVLSDADLHRLLAGPYTSADQALGVAKRLREALSLVPVIVERQ